MARVRLRVPSGVVCTFSFAPDSISPTKPPALPLEAVTGERARVVTSAGKFTVSSAPACIVPARPPALPLDAFTVGILLTPETVRLALDSMVPHRYPPLMTVFAALMLSETDRDTRLSDFVVPKKGSRFKEAFPSLDRMILQFLAALVLSLWVTMEASMASVPEFSAGGSVITGEYQTSVISGSVARSEMALKRERLSRILMMLAFSAVRTMVP